MSDLDVKMMAAQMGTGFSMGDLTVLAAQRDPYRIGADAHQRNADWLAEAIDRIGITDRIHLRGLHYRLVGSVNLPDGKPYTNTDKNWLFLSEKAAFAARFIGTVDFDLIRDNRNDAPDIWTPEFIEPRAWIKANVDIEIPSVYDLMPKPAIGGTLARQPWRLAIVGEKSSLYDLIAPIAKQYEATLALPNGEISTTMVEQIVRAADDDDRPLAVIYLADCDPAGWQMCISFARKAQAIIDLRYPDVRMRVHPVALTPEQSKNWDLPSTPLKDTEKRADRWMTAMGIAQTEIDAAIARAPDELEGLVASACSEYYDHGLNDRKRKAVWAWYQEAETSLADQIGPEELAQLREKLAGKLDGLREIVREVQELTQIDPEELGIELPDIPDVVFGYQDGEDLPSLIDTDDGFITTTQKLKARKAYL